MDLYVELFLVFVRLGLLSFGGGNVALAEMQREIVGRGWLVDSQFGAAYAIGQLSPGPSSLFIVPIGYQIAGTGGAIAATLGYLLPTGLVTFAAILLWGRLRSSRWPGAVRAALVPVTMGFVLASTYTVGRSILLDAPSVGMAAASALLLWRTRLPAPAVLLLVGLIGSLALNLWDPLMASRVEP